MSPPKDISNRETERRVRWDLVLSVFVILFGGAVAWGQTQSSVKENSKEIEKIQSDQETTKKSIVQIEKNVVAIQTNMENMKDNMNELKESVDQDLDEIKKLLRERNQ